MSSTRGVVAVTSLALEADIASGPGVSVICVQGLQLAAALEAAIARGARGVISFGIAGGLAPELRAGDCIVAAAVQSGEQVFPTDQVWTRTLLSALPGALHRHVLAVDAPVAHPVEKRQLHAETGAAVVDTESHIAARVAAAHRIPFAVCRVVIDAAHRRLPPAALVGLHDDGTPDVRAVFGSVMRQPRQLPTLARTALDAQVARNALRRGRRLLGVGLAFPYFSDRASELLVSERGEPVLSTP